MESIFESLENLNVSEECFEDIIRLVEKQLNEGLTSTIAPILAGKGKGEKEESIGTKIDRASLKHPVITKVAQSIDNVFQKRHKDTRTPEEKLTSVHPSGTHLGKDMYSSGQLKNAGYKS